MQHIICYSGGHSSALVAIEVVRRYGRKNVVLLNHNINPRYEDKDIKRFKKEVADYLQLPIIYANYERVQLENKIPNQFEVCEQKGSFINPNDRNALCTYMLKTKPFMQLLKEVFPNGDCIVYYGFDVNEPHRIERRKNILKKLGYNSDYPLALWSREGVDKYNEYQAKLAMKVHNKVSGDIYKDYNKFIADYPQYKKEIDWRQYVNYERTIFSTEEIGIEPPNTYNVFKHANCIGCLKAGQQHWYVVYCHDKETFDRAKLSEERIGYSIIKGTFLKDLESKFEKMKCVGIKADEHLPSQTFWANAKKYLNKVEEDEKPCECFI